MQIPELADALNRAAGEFEIGRLQNLRVRLRSLERAPSSSVFSPRTTHSDYAFHVGGRTELQFNIGEEEQGNRVVIRHGVAFSLQLSQTLPTIDPLLPKIERFNDYVRTHPEDFAGLRMWHFDGQGRSADRPVGPIPDELITAGTFIAIGRCVAADNVNVSEILADFDRLLPLYCFVESDNRTSAAPAQPPFEPGCPEFVVNTTADLRERIVDVALRHKLLQRKLYEYLCQEAGHENVRVEHPLELGVRVDAAVRDTTRFTFYELKVAPTVQSCVRAAVGQLLEYAYWPSAERAAELIIVGEAEMDADAAAYLRLLRDRFALPLWYRRIDIALGTLGAKS